MNQDDDRLFELSLLEAAGGETPPDLAGQILAAARHGVQQPEPLRDSKADSKVDSKYESRGDSRDESGVRVDLVEERDLTPAPSDLSSTWARPGQLRRWQRSRRFAAAALASVVTVALAGWAHQESQARLRARHALQLRSTLRLSMTASLERARSVLRDARWALGAGEPQAAREAVRGVTLILDGLASPLRGQELAAEVRDLRYAARALELRASAWEVETSLEADGLRSDLKLLGAEVPDQSLEHARALLAQGELELLLGRPDAAEELLASIPAPHADMRDVRLALARANSLRGLHEDAQHLLTRVLTALGEGKPASGDASLSDERSGQLRARVLLERSRIYLAQGSEGRERALRDAQAALALGSWRAHLGIAAAQVANGQWLAAERSFADAIRASGGAREAHLARARALLEVGERLDVAEADVEAALSQDPADPSARLLEVQLHELRLQFPEAKQAATQLVRGASVREWREAAAGHCVLARCAAYSGDWVEAAEHARRAALRDPYSSEALLVLARVEASPSFDGQWLEGAERNVERVRRLGGSSALVNRTLGWINEQRFPEDPARAIYRYELALEADGRDVEALYGLSRAALAKARLAQAPELRAAEEQAARRFQQRAERASRDPRRAEGRAYSHGLRLEVLLAMPQREIVDDRRARDQATRSYQRALWLAPSHALARAGLARLWSLSGRHETARAQIAAGLRADPLSKALLVLRADEWLSEWIESERAPSRLVLAQLAEAIDGGEASDRLALLRAQGAFLNAAGKGLGAALSAFEAPLVGTTLSSLEILEARERCLSWLVRTQDQPSVREARREARGALRAVLDRREEDGLMAAKLLEVNATSEWSDVSEQVSHLERTVRLAPTHADAWSSLATARLQAGSHALALSAALRASHLSPERLPALLQMLKAVAGELGSTPSIAASDQEVLRLDPGIIQASWLAGRAGDQRLTASDVKPTVDVLEAYVGVHPTEILPQLLIGLLADSVGRDDYAAQHLVFAAGTFTFDGGLGELAYRAAVAVARGRQESRGEALTVKLLRDASRRGFAWAQAAKDEPAFARLSETKDWLVLVAGE